MRNAIITLSIIGLLCSAVVWLSAARYHGPDATDIIESQGPSDADDLDIEPVDVGETIYLNITKDPDKYDSNAKTELFSMLTKFDPEEYKNADTYLHTEVPIHVYLYSDDDVYDFVILPGSYKGAIMLNEGSST